MLKNNKIVDLITHRELTLEEIHKRAHSRQLVTGAPSIRSPYFWPTSNAPTVQSLTTAGLSSWINKIKKMMRAPHAAEFNLNDTYNPSEDEVWDMIISAANQKFQGEENVVPTQVVRPQVISQVKESFGQVRTFLERQCYFVNLGA